jgi:hypothetical protein
MGEVSWQVELVGARQFLEFDGSLDFVAVLPSGSAGNSVSFDCFATMSGF